MPRDGAVFRYTGTVHLYDPQALEFACVLRKAHAEGKAADELRTRKRKRMMETVYHMLCIALGKPPKSFPFEIRNKKKGIYPGREHHRKRVF